ncbi:MAG: 4-alpha-glucanotransferase, partial [Flavobacterium psychrophilum]
MRSPGLFDWKEAPFLRFTPPFIIGIIIQWYSNLSPAISWTIATGCIAGLALLSRLSIPLQFRYRYLFGILLNGLLLAAGLLLTCYKDIRHQSQWFAHHYTAGDTLVATIEEPLTEKTKTYSTTVTIKAIIKDGKQHTAKGRLLLYLKKEKQHTQLQYGDQLIFIKTPVPITNISNKNGFNYAQYCAYKGMYHQVYLCETEYTIAEKKQINPVKKVLFHTRKKVLDIIRENIPDKKQAGLAEAILIGYRNDLDKQLLQSYINTGVVHVIAVSGLHLGIIYGLLILLFNRVHKRWMQQWTKPIILIVALWLFALLTGASPSVLRSAIMFTCLIIGNQLPHPSSAYNSLAASAFLLLCYDPFLCWDVGFQLSYAAVLSILVFMKPVYNSIYISNKYLDQGWKLVTITIAAQILTLPVSIYHFHQFPNLFLITNLLAVPLSGIILIGELVLCAVSFIPLAAKAIGWLLTWLINLLNNFIEAVTRIPYNTTDDIQLSLSQAILLYIIIGGFTSWLLQK